MTRPAFRAPPCPTCPPSRCTCPNAKAFACSLGEVLPWDETGALLGDRQTTREQRQALADRAEAAQRIRIYGDWCEARLAAIRLAPPSVRLACQEEQQRLTLHLEFIRLKFHRDPPAGVAELGRLIGSYDHAGAVHRWKQIVAAANARKPLECRPVAPRCSRCAKPIVAGSRIAGATLGGATISASLFCACPRR